VLSGVTAVSFGFLLRGELAVRHSVRVECLSLLKREDGGAWGVQYSCSRIQSYWGRPEMILQPCSCVP
jgi:hypothetical protein